MDRVIVSGVAILTKQKYKYTPKLKDFIWEEAGISMHFPTQLDEGIEFSVAVAPITEADCAPPQHYKSSSRASVVYKIESNATTLRDSEYSIV